MMRFLFVMLVGIALAAAACGTGTSRSAEKTESGLSESDRQEYLSRGKEIALSTFDALSGRLGEALQKGGVDSAVQYCNLVAYPLVDSLSEAYRADIRRTSLKVRNPEDRPTETERLVLEKYHALDTAGEELKPKVELVDGQAIAFYAPIRVQPMCLQCHGRVGEELSEEDFAFIRSLYPSDEATGYRAGDLRGMWSIRFTRSE